MTGVDLGASKICAVVGSSPSEVHGLAVVPMPGWPERIPSAADLGRGIARAVSEADAMAGRHRTRGVWIALPGTGTKYAQARGVVKTRVGQGITRADLDRAVVAAGSPGSSAVQRVLVSSCLDGAETLESPLGRTACRLEVLLLTIEAEDKVRTGLRQAVAAGGLSLLGCVAGALALEDVLTPGEREIGTAVLDLGASQTTLAVFARGAPRFLSAVGLGGLHVTRDLAVALGLPFDKAEQEKLALNVAADAPMGSRVVASRLAEILESARAELDRTGWGERIPGGCVMTGGGARAAGLTVLAQKVLERPVRIGLPGLGQSQELVAGPSYAVALGLLGAVCRYRKDGDAGALPKEVGRWRSKSPQHSLPA